MCSSDLSKLVSNIDTSVLVGQLSNMIGKNIQWSVDSSSTDENGKVTTTTTKLEGTVTGVSISDGSPTIVASADGHSYKVDIGNITRIGEGVQGS